MFGQTRNNLCGVCYSIRWEKTVATEGFVKCTVGKSCCQKLFRSQAQISVRWGIHKLMWERDAWNVVSSLLVERSYCRVHSFQPVHKQKHVSMLLTVHLCGRWKTETFLTDKLSYKILFICKNRKTPTKHSPLFSSLAFSPALSRTLFIFGKSIRFWWIKAVNPDKLQCYPL